MRSCTQRWRANDSLSIEGAGTLQRNLFRSLIVVVLALWMVSTSTYHKSIVNKGDDFLIFLSSARKLTERKPLYDKHALEIADFSNTYVYMPTIALLLIPFAADSPLTVFRCWNLLMILAMISSCVIFCFTLSIKDPRADPVPCLICIFTIAHCHMTDMNFFAGQANFLILLSITLIMFWLKQRNWAAVATCMISASVVQNRAR